MRRRASSGSTGAVRGSTVATTRSSLGTPARSEVDRRDEPSAVELGAHHQVPEPVAPERPRGDQGARGGCDDIPGPGVTRLDGASDDLRNSLRAGRDQTVAVATRGVAGAG